MSSVKQRYHAISPVTLQLVGGAVSSSLYCGEVEGLSGEGAGLVEAFLVELYRCRLCQFTCGLKTAISSHLLHRHRPPALTYLGDTDEGGGAEGGEEAGLQQGASPYQLDLNGQLKQSDEDEDFLLYNMLDNMSPPPCDITTEGGLQVAHTCEVRTLFEEEEEEEEGGEEEEEEEGGEEEEGEEEEEEEEGGEEEEGEGSSVDLSCPIAPPSTQEEMAQSAHLMTLGLCRISASRPPPPLPPTPSQPPPLPEDPPPLSQADLKQSRQTSHVSTTTRRRTLPCFLCPVTLPSRRLLDVHVQSHRAAGGFSCVHCSWTVDRWEELEPHWRSHCKRRRRRRRREEKEEEEEEEELLSCSVCLKTLSSQNTGLHCSCSDGWRGLLIGQAGGKEAEHTDRQTPGSQSDATLSVTSRRHTGSLQNVTDRKKRRKKKKKSRRKKNQEEEEQTGFCCSLCHRKFSSKLTLRRHLSVHTGEKPFTCPHCAYCSRLKGSLLQHLRTHTGEKPYRCAQCSYASIDRSSLLRHCRTHSQEKPYRCQHCDYSSIQKKSLDLHARRHHTGEAFPCQQCEYSSPDRQLLLRHVRRHHAPSPPPCDLTAGRTL